MHKSLQVILLLQVLHATSSRLVLMQSRLVSVLVLFVQLVSLQVSVFHKSQQFSTLIALQMNMAFLLLQTVVSSIVEISQRLLQQALT